MSLRLFKEYYEKAKEYYKETYFETSSLSGSRTKLLENFLKLMNKRHGLKLGVSQILMTSKGVGKEYEGVLCLAQDGKRALMINFEKGSVKIASVYFWFGIYNPDRVDLVFDCSDLNIVQIVEATSEILSKNGKLNSQAIKKLDASILEESIYNDYNEGVVADKRKEVREILDKFYSSKGGIEKLTERKDKNLIKISQLAKEYAEWRAQQKESYPTLTYYQIQQALGIERKPQKSLKERIVKNKRIKTEVKFTSKEKKAWENIEKINNKFNPDETFQLIEGFTATLATTEFERAIPNLLIISGDPGTGKTFYVQRKLKEILGAENNKKNVPGGWVTLSGQVTARGLYENLYFHNGKVIVLDDATSLLKDLTAIDVIKNATNSLPETRKINWATKTSTKKKSKEEEDDDEIKIPGEFFFEGKLIIITNEPLEKLEKNDHGKAVLSRAYTVDVDFSAEQMLERIKENLEKVAPDVDGKIKLECFTLLQSVVKQIGVKKVNFRDYLRALSVFTMQRNIPDKLKQKYIIGILTLKPGGN